MTELPSSAFKENGTLHLRNCAVFYRVQPHTLRVWIDDGAPIYRPADMGAWRAERNRVRLEKIARKSNRHGSKEAEIVRLYLEERLGLRAIAQYFGNRPTTAGVRKILIKAGVYRHGEAFVEQAARTAARQEAVRAREKENIHRVAVCLWHLRKQTPVETTCRQNGWNPKSIWNVIRNLSSYRRLRERQIRRWPDKRRYGKQYSRLYPKEVTFQQVVTDILEQCGLQYVRDCRLSACRSTVDFKLPDGTYIETKVGLNAGQICRFLGQALHYRKFATKVILCVPSDIQLRADLHDLILEVGVIVCNEHTLAATLTGEAVPFGTAQIAEPKAVSFVCKCCGSAEKRRYRSNSYCVECASRIPSMRFDVRINRWVSTGE